MKAMDELKQLLPKKLS